PASSALIAARHVTLSELAANQESRGLQTWDDHYAVGVFQHLLWNAFVRCCHDLGEHGCGFVEPLHTFVVFSQQGHDCQSSRQNHSHYSASSVDPVNPAGAVSDTPGSARLAPNAISVE